MTTALKVSDAWALSVTRFVGMGGSFLENRCYLMKRSENQKNPGFDPVPLTNSLSDNPLISKMMSLDFVNLEVSYINS